MSPQKQWEMGKKGKEGGVKAWGNCWTTCGQIPGVQSLSWHSWVLQTEESQASLALSILWLPGQGKRNHCIELIALCLSTSHETQKDRIYHLEIGLGGEKAHLIDYYPNFCPENHGPWTVEHQLLPRSCKPEVKGCNWVLLLFIYLFYCVISP